MQVSLKVSIFISFGYIPKSEISGSYVIVLFLVLRKLQTIFYNSFANLYSTNSVEGYPFHHTLDNICYFFMAILSDMEIFISLWLWFAFPYDKWYNKNLFKYLLAICYRVIWVPYIFWILTPDLVAQIFYSFVGCLSRQKYLKTPL